MSLFNHLKRSKNDKSGSSSRSPSVEPPKPVPRIVTTTDAPSIVSRDLLNNNNHTKMPAATRARPHLLDRSISAFSAFSTASDATIVAADEARTNNNNNNTNHHSSTRPGVLERAKSAIMTRGSSPSPSSSPESTSRKQLQVGGAGGAPRGNHIVTDAVALYRAKLLTTLKGTKQEKLAAGVSSESLFAFIAEERLRRMPHRGSRWDKILKWAEDFAKKLSLFEVTDDSFIPSSKEAVHLILASVQLLLTVGLPPLPYPLASYAMTSQSLTCVACTSSAHRTARRWSGRLASSTSTDSCLTFTSATSGCW